MIPLLFWCLHFMFFGHTVSDLLHFPAVNRTWLRLALNKKFSESRHYLFGYTGKEAAKQFIVEHFESLSLIVHYDEFDYHGSETMSVRGVNIIGILPGIQSNDSMDTIYLLGAYYDTFRDTDGVFNNGAGVVAMMETARLLVHSGRKMNTLLFVAFDFHFIENTMRSCCQGAKHFANVWLPNYIKERNVRNQKVQFGGAILMESILNYNSTPGSNMIELDEIQTLYVMMFKEVARSIVANGGRGDFILTVSRHTDTTLLEPFKKMWELFSDLIAKILVLEFSSVFSNEFVFNAVEANVVDSDVFAFYRKNYHAILVTDMGRYRGTMQLCYWYPCKLKEFVTSEKIKFLAKTTGTVVLTLELLAIGNMSDTILEEIQKEIHAISTTTPKTIVKHKDKCTEKDYKYDESVNIYYKIYDGVFNKVNWADAKTTCENEGAELLILRNTKMFEFALKTVDFSLWVGMSDIENEGEWKWVDGTNVTIDSWGSCQPDDAFIGEDCGLLNIYNQKIIDVNCNSYLFPFICTCVDNATVSLETDLEDEGCSLDDYNFIEKAQLYYKVFDKYLSHGDAEAICQGEQTHLLSISTLYEYSYTNEIISELGDRTFHINSDKRLHQLFNNSRKTSSENVLGDDNTKCFVLVVNGSLFFLDVMNCSEPLPFICGTYCKDDNLNTLWTDYEQNLFKTTQILVTTDKSIKYFITETPVDLTLLKEIITDEPVYSLDILILKNLLFWHSRKSTFIMVTTLSNSTNGTHQKFVYTGDPHTYLAVDWAYENIYYSTMNSQTISVSNKKFTKILYLENVEKPQHLQLDLMTGLMFWLEPSGIICGYMDGQEKTRIVNGKFNQIAVDFYRSHIFASYDNMLTKYKYIISPGFLESLIHEEEFYMMECFNTGRSSENIDIILYNNYETFLSSHLFSNVKPEHFSNLHMQVVDIFLTDGNILIGIKYIFTNKYPSDLYLQHVYNFDENLKYIKIINKDKMFPLEPNWPYVEFCHSIAFDYCPDIYKHEHNCPQLLLRTFSSGIGLFNNCVCPLDGVFLLSDNGSCDTSVCFHNNGECMQQCNDMDNYPFKYCSCYKGFKLLLDRKTCIHENELEEIILFSGKTNLELYSPQGKFDDRQIIHIEGYETYDSAGIEFDHLERNIYWIQNKVFRIYRTYINGTGNEQFYAGSSTELRALTLDILQRRLFFSVPVNSTIVSVSLDKKVYQKEHQLSTENYASYISLDTFNGFIYYHKQHKLQNDNGIYRINIENKHEEEIVSQIDGPLVLRSFAIDIKAGIIFWLSGKSMEQIQKHQIFGTEGKKMVRKGQLIKYKNLCILGNYLYTTGTRGELGRINMEDEVGYLFEKSKDQITLITGKSFKTIRQNGVKSNESCTELTKCLDASMEWICLSSEQICDGVDQCYDSYDEMYCEYKEHGKMYTHINLSCQNKHAAHQYFYEKRDLMFVDWETHLFSRFINIAESLHIRCSVDYEISNSITSGKQMFKVVYFLANHKFRQLIKSKVLRGRHQFIRVLVLSGQGISQTWSKRTFEDFRDLHSLELLDIKLLVLENDIFIKLEQLQTLVIRVQTLIRIEIRAFKGIYLCRDLTLTGTQIQHLHPQTFNNMSNLINLDVSQNKLTVIDKDLFESMTSLQVIDTRGNDIHILGKIFERSVKLKLIYSDTFALCCVRPKHMTVDDCVAPPFDVSSCENLIENGILRIFLWIIGILAVFGNMGVLFYRSKDNRGLYQDTFSVLVGNLTVADAFIGVYLISIGITDAVFRGEYIWQEYRWRKGAFCTSLGILSVLSSEVSVITISFVTVARYFAVKFPFKEHKISRKNAVFGSVISWIISLFMALFPYFVFDNFYSVSGVCVSLPLRKESTSGWIYSFSLFVVFNFLIFLFIAIAQIPIVYEVKQISSKVQSTGTSKYIEVARRLSLVVATDCLCWIPIGTMGTLAMFGYDMPRTIYAWTVVFILPINSAINPFLYTFIDSKMLGEIVIIIKQGYKALKKKLMVVRGLLAVATALIVITKMLYFIKSSGDYFQLYHQLQQGILQKGNDAKLLTLQTADLHLRLKNIKAHAHQDNCHKPLKEIGIGFCCNDWTDFKKGCFVINSNNLNWYDAEISCREHGFLATVDSDKISAFLKSILLNANKPVSFWIGLYTHLNKQNEYQWLETKANYKYSDKEEKSFVSSCGDLIEPYPCVNKTGFICQIDFSRSKYVPASRCPHGWLEIEHHCFLFSWFKVLWTHARDYCRLYDNANLATVDSRKVNDLLQPILKQKSLDNQQDSFWIGLNRYPNLTNWVWVKTGKLANYTNWDEKPTEHQMFASYERFIDGFKWIGSDYSDYSTKYIICEKDLYDFYNWK